MDSYNPLFRIFKVFALWTVDPLRPDQSVKWLQVYGLGHIAILSTIAILCVLYFNHLLYPGNFVGVMTDVIQLVGPVASHFVMVGELVARVSEQRSIVRGIQSVDSRLMATAWLPRRNSRHLGMDNGKLVGRLLFKLTFASVFCLALDLAILMKATEDAVEWQTMLIVTMYSNIVTRISLLQYVCLVDVLADKVAAINRNLSDCSHRSLARKDAVETSQTSRLIGAQQQAYCDIWRTRNQLNSLFGMSQVMNGFRYFTYLSCSFYFILYHYGNATGAYDAPSLAILPPIVALAILFHASNNYVNQVKRLPFALHRIQSDQQLDETMRQQIRKFSLLIQLLPMDLNAMGMFQLNYGTLKDMFAAISIYMLILFQFA